MAAGWRVAGLEEIPPAKADWPASWKSVRHHLGVTAFGINAVTKDAGENLIPEHDESESGQQEVFFVHQGAVDATLDGETVRLEAGAFLAPEPRPRRRLAPPGAPPTPR